MKRHRDRLRRALPAAAAGVLVMAIASGFAALVAQRNATAEQQLFDRDVALVVADIEQEVQRHFTVVDDVATFAAVTAPGNLEQWRDYLEGRVTGGNYLAFTSTAGYVERVPADQLEAVIERERVSDPTFQVSEPFPLAPDADRLILIRTAEPDTADNAVRGLEMSAAVHFLQLDLPNPGDRVLVEPADDAPNLVLDVLGIEPALFASNDVVSSNLFFVRAVGEVGEEPLGWVVIPADLGYLLERIIDDLQTEVSISIGFPAGEGVEAVGSYRGAGDLVQGEAELSSVRTIEISGWDWTISVWGDPASVAAVNPFLILAIGAAASLLGAFMVENRRRSSDDLVSAQVELSLQRTLAETDHLTGLLNRQGLAASRSTGKFSGIGAVLYVDLNGFKAINDEYGHAAGDDLLVAVARAIRQVARAGDVAVRVGGDEFVLICPGLGDHTVAARRRDAIVDEIAQISDVGGVRASVGLALAERSLRDELDQLIERADAEMYRNKPKSGSRR